MSGKERQPTRQDHEKACGAPLNAPWGYLACGCANDGFGRHAAIHGYARKADAS